MSRRRLSWAAAFWAALWWWSFYGPAWAGDIETVFDQNKYAVFRKLVPHLDDSRKKVELFWACPKSSAPAPVVFFIHGHQNDWQGASRPAQGGWLGRLAGNGYLASAISQPGYGASDGPPDFCGPFTQRAVITCLEFLRRQPSVKKDKIMLYGVSRGAIVAGMVATQVRSLAGVLLVGGIYDFQKGYPTGITGLDDNIRNEAGLSPEAFRARSAAQHVDKIKCPVLLMHGENDDRYPAEAVKDFAAKLKQAGVDVDCIIFSNTGHAINPAKRGPFFNEFRRKCLN